MFAFCPKTSPKMCGFSPNDANDPNSMKILASFGNVDKQVEITA